MKALRNSIRKTRYMAALFVWLAATTGGEVFAAPGEEKEALAREVAALFRAARKVLSDNQDLINDPAKGDKGLTPERIIDLAKENYQKAVGKSLDAPNDSTVAGQAQTAIFQAIQEVMVEAQPLINERGKGFKGFLPAVFARLVAKNFSQKMQGKIAIKLTAPRAFVRNRVNNPDEWEDQAIETKFLAAGWEKGKAFGEVARHKNGTGYRLILPEYYGESCLGCHGKPKGDIDITGGTKEGATLGDLGGAISIVIFE